MTGRWVSVQVVKLSQEAADSSALQLTRVGVSMRANGIQVIKDYQRRGAVIGDVSMGGGEGGGGGEGRGGEGRGGEGRGGEGRGGEGRGGGKGK